VTAYCDFTTEARFIVVDVKCGAGRIRVFGRVTERGENMAKGRDKRKESKGKKKAPKKPASAG